MVRRTLKVKPEKIRVLYIEGAPRWEYRYLKNALARADKSIVFHSFLTSAGQGFAQECSKGERPLGEIPNDRQQLLENYDVIIFGDVPPTSSARRARTATDSWSRCASSSAAAADS